MHNRWRLNFYIICQFFGNYVIWPEQPENIGTTLFILALNIEEKLISNVGLWIGVSGFKYKNFTWKSTQSISWMDEKTGLVFSCSISLPPQYRNCIFTYDFSSSRKIPLTNDNGNKTDNRKKNLTFHTD